MPDGRRVRRAGSPRLCKSVKKRRSPENPKGTNTTTWRSAPRQLMNGAEADPKESRMKEVCRLGHKYRYQRDILESWKADLCQWYMFDWCDSKKTHNFCGGADGKPVKQKTASLFILADQKLRPSIKSVITFASQNRASHQGRKKSHTKAAKKLMQISRTNHYCLEHALVRA